MQKYSCQCTLRFQITIAIMASVPKIHFSNFTTQYNNDYNLIVYYYHQYTILTQYTKKYNIYNNNFFLYQLDKINPERPLKYTCTSLRLITYLQNCINQNVKICHKYSSEICFHFIQEGV